LKNPSKPKKTVLPIHFEDRSGSEFERLSFAYICNTRDWSSIDWYGQLGADCGRDIWAVTRDDWGNEESYCYQCANHQSLKFKKAQEDIDKIVAGPHKTPDHFVLIAGGSVSAALKDRIVAYAKLKGIASAQVWTGVEFEERLRRDTPSLIRRFCEGEEFPESPSALQSFSANAAATSDQEILSLIAQCFDRPAFTTPFHQESSIPAFKQAITDTIEVLNTGVHRLRDGTEIRRIPTRHNLQDESTKRVLSGVVTKLVELRTAYDAFLESGDIKSCACSVPECSVFFSSLTASRSLDRIREEILDSLRSIYPTLQIAQHWR
jgi:hypothetical protein